MEISRKSIKISLTLSMFVYVSLMTVWLLVTSEAPGDHTEQIVGMIILAIGMVQNQFDFILAVQKWCKVYNEWRAQFTTWEDEFEKIRGRLVRK